MKRISLITFFCIGTSLLYAQSLEQGNQLLYYQRYNSAENIFHQLIQQNVNNAEAWSGLVKAYVLQKKLDKANDTLEHAPASIQSEPYYQIAKGTVLLLKENVADASNYFSSALSETNEKDANILGAISEANILAEKGDANYAIQLLAKAIKRDKRNPHWNVLIGDAYLKLHNGSEAYKAFRNAVDKNDKYAEAYHKLGEIFVSQKNPDLYVENFRKAIVADPSYAPSLYELYVYEFNRDPQKAMDYYQRFELSSDTTIQNDYDLADLYYVNKDFDNAIKEAKNIIKLEGKKAQPRLYKLMAYSLSEKKDTTEAITYMNQYFLHQPDSNVISRDFETMSSFYNSIPDHDSLAMTYLAKAAHIEKDSGELIKLYQKLTQLAADQKDFVSQAMWLGKYYQSNSKATNIDLFNWGLASYRAGDYVNADSVFGLYVAKYPEQSFGYYWQARTKALEDQDMKEGLAVPAYKKVIEVLEQNSKDPNYKKWITDAYSYLAAYEVNTEKDYAEAIDYFEKVLTIDPENANAKKYIDVLEKSLADKGTK